MRAPIIQTLPVEDPAKPFRRVDSDPSKRYYRRTLKVPKVLVREPRLMVPGKKPLGRVTVDWNHPMTRGLDACLIMLPSAQKNLAPGPVTGPSSPIFVGLGDTFVLRHPTGGQVYSIVRNNPAWSAAVGTYKNGNNNYSVRANPSTNTCYFGHYSAPNDAMSGMGAIDTFANCCAAGDVVHGMMCLESGVRYAKQWFNKGASKILEGATAATEGSMTWLAPYAAYNDPVYFYYWNRYMEVGERTEFLRNPYQFLIPA